MCLCFFQEAFETPDQGQNLSDVIEVYAIAHDEECHIDQERERRESRWRSRHTGARVVTPGFLHAIFHTRYLCEDGAMGSVSRGETKENHLIAVASDHRRRGE